MEKYHKIQTVFKRDPENNFKTIMKGYWSKREFGYLADNTWIGTEKVDGTNIRITWDGVSIRIKGKSDNAQVYPGLYDRIKKLVTQVEFPEKFGHEGGVCLYGEGYGAKIQKGGGNYKPDGQDFVLFDVKIGDMWLERENVENIADWLGVETVPIIWTGDLWGAIAIVQAGFTSTWGEFAAEGLVLRPEVEMYSRRGERIITKIKTKDFDKLRSRRMT